MQANTMEDFWNRVQDGDKDSCWPWLGDVDGHGYGRFCFGGVRRTSHQYACAEAHGPRPEGLCVLHSCDNPPCCNPAHLRYGTHKENSKEMAKRGRNSSLFKKGVRPANAKLTDVQVRALRSQAAMGATQHVLSDRYGLSVVSISLIVNRHKYKDVL